MLRLLRAGFISLLVSVTFFTTANAGGNDSNYEQGSVWTIGYIETKPGKFNAYMNNLEGEWLRYIKAQKDDGDVLSYKVLAVAAPRDGEPNLILMVEWKNMGVFDRSEEYWKKLTKRLTGSMDKLVKDSVDRETLRTLRGEMITRELVFKSDLE